MKNLSLIILVASLWTAFAVTSAGNAQEADEELRKEIERTLPEADAFARKLRDAIEAASREAEAAKAGGQMNVGRFEAAPGDQAAGNGQGFDIDRILAEQVPAFADARQAQINQIPPLLVMASLAMPDDSLRALMRDVNAVGGQVVLRGFLEGSVPATAARIAALIGDSENGSKDASGMIVDPRLFRIFSVGAVPAFVIPAGPLGICDEPGCTAPPPPHDRISGNITLRYALERIAGEGEHANERARAYLERLDAKQ